MLWPQWSMAITLAGETALAAFSWWAGRRIVAPVAVHLGPRLRLAYRWGWVAGLIPLTEAWVLWCGNFWSQ